MQIGGMNHPGRDPLAEITWFGKNGFDFVDFTFEPPCADPGNVDPAAVKAALAKYNLGVVTHSAWFIPISSPFKTIREAALAEFRRVLTAAHAIGAGVMNVHYWNVPPLIAAEKAVAWNAEILAPLCDEAADLGVTIVIENTPNQGPRQLETLTAILERVPLLRFHLDSGHTKLERGYDRWEEYLQTLGHKLAHVHLSENDGSSDQHLPLGAAPRSHTNWPKHIKMLKSTGYDGTISLEVFAEARDYLLVSKKLLRRWWNEA